MNFQILKEQMYLLYKNLQKYFIFIHSLFYFIIIHLKAKVFKACYCILFFLGIFTSFLFLPFSELFTNCLDMISTLLGSLSSEFHYTLAGSGEEGKKVHTGCIKKIKAEIAGSKSNCASEIRQLFPITPNNYCVITVKPPPSMVHSKGATANDRIKVRCCLGNSMHSEISSNNLSFLQLGLSIF